MGEKHSVISLTCLSIHSVRSNWEMQTSDRWRASRPWLRGRAADGR